MIKANPFCISCNGFYREWDQFTLNAPSTITHIQALLSFTDLGFGLGTGDLEYSIWSPDLSVVFYSEHPTNFDIPDVVGSGYDVTAHMTPFALQAGIYSLSIYNPRTDVQVGWFQSDVTVDGHSFQSDGGSGTGIDLAFRIIGDGLDTTPTPTPCPEPSTYLLFATGLAGLLGYGWRRKPA
jgi:hypothetical protein